MTETTQDFKVAHGNLPIVLRGYHWSQTEIEKTPADGIFYLAMNMTSACNYACKYCFVGLEFLKCGPNEMTLDQKRRLIQEGADCGAKVLVMPGRGEPLSDPHFWHVLEEANRVGLYVVVYTNGYFLDENLVKRLRDSAISVYLKMDSQERAVYEALVGKSGVFDKVNRNLHLLLSHFHRPVVEAGRIVSRLGINSVVTVQSMSAIESLDRWCQERNIFYTCRSPVKVGEAALEWNYLVGQRVNDLRTIGQAFASRAFTSGTDKGQCGIYRWGITIENTGEIYMCPDARIDAGFPAIGNVKTTALRDLIMRRIRAFPLNSKRGFCFVKAALNPEEGKKSTQTDFV